MIKVNRQEEFFLDWFKNFYYGHLLQTTFLKYLLIQKCIFFSFLNL